MVSTPIRSALVALLTLAATAPVRAQNPPPTAKPAIIPVKVTVTISRYQGEKRISSLPYHLSATLQPQQQANGPRGYANLRIGTRVPITGMTQDKGTPSVPTVTYQEVGTNIDCSIFPPDEAGRYRLELTIDESSVYEDPAAKVVQIGRPTLRSFRTSASLMVKDGESVEASNTPDRMTGESVRVDVTLAIVK